MICSFQFKRLKNEDQLQELVLRGSKRKLGDSNDAREPLTDHAHTFCLASTYQTRQPGETLQSAFENADSWNRMFSLPSNKRVKKGFLERNSPSDETMAGLQSMVEGYINSQNNESPVSEAEADKETEDYVYGVYFNSQTNPPSDSLIGYLDPDKEEENLLFDCSDSEDRNAAEDDEDSNAENFYLDDYPEEDKFRSSSEDESDAGFSSESGLHIETWSEESADESDALNERYGWRN